MTTLLIILERCGNHTHSWLQFSAPNCAIAYIYTVILLMQLLTMALINNGEVSEEVGRLVNKILRYLSYKDIAFFVFCGYLLRIIYPD